MAQEPTTTATTTNFLLNTTTPAGLGTDNFILQVTGFTRNGVPVSVPGLGSTFGLYLEGTVSVQGTPSVYSPGTVALVLDPTNNDGTPGATWDPATQSGSIGFSNLVNTADDITLATGSFVSGAFGIQSNGQPGVNFVQTLDLNPAIFGPNSGTNLNISETLFNTATSRLAGTTTAGGSYITANDGYGTINLTQTSVVGDHSPSFCGGRTASQILAEPGTLASSGGSQSLDIRAIADEILAAFGVTLPASFLPGGHSGPSEKHPNSAFSGGSYDSHERGGRVSDLFSRDSHGPRH